MDGPLEAVASDPFVDQDAAEETSETQHPQEHWSEKFKYDLYDWNDLGWKRRNRGKRAWLPVLLTQGYFMAVSKLNYKRMTRYPDKSPKRWHAEVKRSKETGKIEKVYGARRGRGDEPKDVLAHRELLGCLDKPGDVDHVNGWGLDNRLRINLHYARNGENVINSVGRRRKNFELPPGVEPVVRTRGGKRVQRFKGIWCRRSIKRKKGERGKVETTRSKMEWTTPEPAARWYLNQMRSRHRGRSWIHDHSSIDFPDFPPLLEHEISEQELKMRRRAARKSREEDIPF